MKIIKLVIILLCIVAMQSCNSNKKTDQCKNFTDIRKNIPDSLYTIPVQLLNYYAKENYNAEYNNRAYDEIYYLKDKLNDKISIMYTKEGDNYMLEIKKIREEYKAFYIIWENLSMDTFSLFRDSIVFYSNIDSSMIKNYVPHYNGRSSNKNYKQIIIDFNKNVKNLDFFNEIKYIE
jgi:hypothetical protein